VICNVASERTDAKWKNFCTIHSLNDEPNENDNRLGRSYVPAIGDRVDPNVDCVMSAYDSDDAVLNDVVDTLVVVPAASDVVAGSTMRASNVDFKQSFQVVHSIQVLCLLNICNM